MDEEYLPLYEVVDHSDQVNTAQDSRNKYEKLNAADTCVQEEYQQPHSSTRYDQYLEDSETITEILLMKRNLKCIKLVFVTTGLVALVFVVATVVTITAVSTSFAKHTAATFSSLVEQVDALNLDVDGLTNSHQAVNTFENCSQEITSCNFTSLNSDTLWYCDTRKLYIHKEVRKLLILVTCMHTALFHAVHACN